jgi:prepilin-type N-terminal cleavage/methylation domain-containing protein
MRAETHETVRPTRKGFTLIELLVVMVILAIVIALAVAISGYISEESSRKRTQTAMSKLRTAIQQYKEEQGHAPSDAWDTGEWGAEPGDLSDEEISTVALLKRLETVPESKKVVEQLEEEIFTGWGEPDPEPLKDGFGHPMEYQKEGGRGKTFVLISPGPDGKMNDKADNIRSDNQ